MVVSWWIVACLPITVSGAGLIKYHVRADCKLIKYCNSVTQHTNLPSSGYYILPTCAFQIKFLYMLHISV